MNNQIVSTFVLCCVLLTILINVSECVMYMDVFPGLTRCIGQELDEEDSALFTFGANHVTDGTYAANVIAAHKDIQKVTASIIDPKGNNIINSSSGEKKKESVDGGSRSGSSRASGVILINSQRPIEKFIEKVPFRGVYKICYELTGGEIPVRAHFNIDFQSSKGSNGSSDPGIKSGRGGNAITKSDSKIKSGDVPIAETKLQYAEESLHAIHKEIEYAKIQEK